MNEQHKTLEQILRNILECRKFFKDSLLAGGYKNPGVAFAAEQVYKIDLATAKKYRKLAVLYESQYGYLNGDIFNAIDMFEKELHDSMVMLRNTGYTNRRVHSKLPEIVVGLIISIAILTVSIGVQIIWGYFCG